MSKKPDQILFKENAELKDHEPVLVHRRSGLVEVNPRIFNRVSSEMRDYFLLWAKHKHNNGKVQHSIVADALALRDCYDKGYDIRNIVDTYIPILMSNPTESNQERVQAILNFMQH